MNRRHFLKLLSLALAAPSVLMAGRAVALGEHVLIVGAGMAGIAAAYRLRKAGYRVTLLEGRDRIGGRIWTSQLWPGTPLDLGASWIHHKQGNPITVLANNVHAKTVATHYGNSWAYGQNGAELSGTEQRRLSRLSQDLQDLIREFRKVNDRSFADTIAPTLAAYSATDRFLFNFLVNTEIEHEFAADAAELSPLAIDFGEEFQGPDVLFPGGYSQILAPLVKELDIRTGRKVETIRYGGQGVTVETPQGAISGDRAIVTVPLGVLQKGDIRFIPDLPDWKQAAIQSMGMGLLNKTYLRFPKAFWPKAPDLFQHVAEPRGQWAEWYNFYHYFGKPILLGFNAAAFGREIEAWSDQDIVASAMDVLRTIYGNGIPEPNGTQITRWSMDPFAWGSYSFLRPGNDAGTFEHLAQPVDERVFFAGEATSADYFATVHGAYLSGRRSAGEIMGLGHFS